MTSKETVGI